MCAASTFPCYVLRFIDLKFLVRMGGCARINPYYWHEKDIFLYEMSLFWRLCPRRNCNRAASIGNWTHNLIEEANYFVMVLGGVRGFPVKRWVSIALCWFSKTRHVNSCDASTLKKKRRHSHQSQSARGFWRVKSVGSVPPVFMRGCRVVLLVQQMLNAAESYLTINITTK